MTPEQLEDAWIDWSFGNDEFYELEKEGYTWVFLTPDAHDLAHGDVDLGTSYVVITDEFPHGAIVMARKMVSPRLWDTYDLRPIGLETRKKADTMRILAFFDDDEIIEIKDRYGGVAIVHPCTRPTCKWQGTKFDKDGPYGHVEADTKQRAVERLVEDGFREPDPGGMKRVLGARGNPPYSGYDPIYYRRKLPKDLYRISYKRKRDALNVFLDYNSTVVGDYGGASQKHLPASFDAINHYYDLTGKRRVDTIAKAAWWALQQNADGKYYLADINVDLLNRTAPAIYNPRNLEFKLPDYVEEEELRKKESDYWEQYADVYEGLEDEEVPF